jgi:hypothetical protein
VRSGNSVPLICAGADQKQSVYLHLSFLPFPSQLSAAALELQFNPGVRFPLAHAAYQAHNSLDCTRVSAACTVLV